MAVIGQGGQVIPGARPRVIKQPAIAPITTPNATDLATAIALANANKTTVNALITALQASGVTA